MLDSYTSNVNVLQIGVPSSGSNHSTPYQDSKQDNVRSPEVKDRPGRPILGVWKQNPPSNHPEGDDGKKKPFSNRKKLPGRQSNPVDKPYWEHDDRF